LAELTDVAPATILEQEVRRAAGSVNGVLALEKCLIRKMGFDFYVDLHVMVDGNMPVRHGHDIAHQVKDSIRQANPKVADVLVHIEPADP
jgi:divalent metal cation (Fe/Co/Zn/Cd) transporter